MRKTLQGQHEGDHDHDRKSTRTRCERRARCPVASTARAALTRPPCLLEQVVVRTEPLLPSPQCRPCCRRPRRRCCPRRYRCRRRRLYVAPTSPSPLRRVAGISACGLVTCSMCRASRPHGRFLQRRGRFVIMYARFEIAWARTPSHPRSRACARGAVPGARARACEARARARISTHLEDRVFGARAVLRLRRAHSRLTVALGCLCTRAFFQSLYPCGTQRHVAPQRIQKSHAENISGASAPSRVRDDRSLGATPAGWRPCRRTRRQTSAGT